jgi:hypothetical protein
MPNDTGQTAADVSRLCFIAMGHSLLEFSAVAGFGAGRMCEGYAIGGCGCGQLLVIADHVRVNGKGFVRRR